MSTLNAFGSVIVDSFHSATGDHFSAEQRRRVESETAAVVSATPRPAWRDSTPRWRRRMLAGVWLLVLMPMLAVLNAAGWDKLIPVSIFYEFEGAVETLEHSFLVWTFAPVMFCMGVVLLFSKERFGRYGKFDWTRRWGVLCSYVVFGLFLVGLLFLCALVLAGLSALFLTLPPGYRPSAAGSVTTLSWSYLRYGPQPGWASDVTLTLFSCVTMLLACVPLHDALRSTGRRVLAWVPLSLLASLSIFQLGVAGYAFFRPTDSWFSWLTGNAFYFNPSALARGLAVVLQGPSSWSQIEWSQSAELLKWGSLVMIGVSLTFAQFTTRRVTVPSETAALRDA